MEHAVYHYKQLLLNLSYLVEYSTITTTLVEQYRPIRGQLFLILVTLVLRNALVTSPQRILNSFLDVYGISFTLHSVVEFLLYVPEITSQEIIYRMEKDCQKLSYEDMSTSLLREAVSVFVSIDLLISEVLSAFDITEISLPVHSNRSLKVFILKSFVKVYG